MGPSFTLLSTGRSEHTGGLDWWDSETVYATHSCSLFAFADRERARGAAAAAADRSQESSESRLINCT